MSGQLIGVDLTSTSTTQLFPLGSLHVTETGNHYRYMQADGAVVATELMSYTPGTWQVEDQIDATANPATAHAVAVCVSGNAMADNAYGWVFVGPGEVTVLTDATGVAGAEDIVYASATAGTASSGATAALLNGVIAPAAITGATAGTLYAATALYCVDLV